MTIYVDDYRKQATVNGIRSRWSHLMSDGPTQELVEFAESIGLKRQWIQHEGKILEHFDVTDPKREAALKAGAVELHGLEGGYLTMAKRKGEPFDLKAVRIHRETLKGGVL